MKIHLDHCTLRPFREGDQTDLVEHANNPRVAHHMRERFPRPYSRQDADDWLALVAQQWPTQNFAITLDDRVVGGIGLTPGTDVHRVSWETGYWLGESVWGRGIATCALAGLTRYAFGTFVVLNRLFANVDAHHGASIRVLQKAGFRCEGKFLGCVVKEGQILDQFVYAITRQEAADLFK